MEEKKQKNEEMDEKKETKERNVQIEHRYERGGENQVSGKEIRQEE